jgi:hypothetical protein
MKRVISCLLFALITSAPAFATSVGLPLNFAVFSSLLVGCAVWLVSVKTASRFDGKFLYGLATAALLLASVRLVVVSISGPFRTFSQGAIFFGIWFVIASVAWFFSWMVAAPKHRESAQAA